MKAHDITADDLEYGLGILARILDTQGDAVWPLFERLERELADIQSRRVRIERHLREKIPANDRKEDRLRASSKQAKYKVG